MVVVVGEDGVEDPVLVDLLRGMISGSRWCYAEMWLPNAQAGRYLITASYARPGKGVGLRALESLSRALALRPTDCLLRRAQSTISASSVSTVDPTADGLAASPRAGSLREASIASALSFNLVDGQLDQTPIGIVVLMSQSGPASDAEERASEVLALERISSLCASANPYLRHIEWARNDRAGRASKQADHPLVPADLNDSSVSGTGQADVMFEKQQHARSPITYSSPLPRRKFNAVAEDVRPKRSFTSSPSANKLGIKDGASLSVEYQIAITEALSNFPPHGNGKPHAVRVSALWSIFEQLCEVPSAISNVLKLMRLELKQAIFSDDLMSADDGLSLMRVPFFEQIDYRVQQVIERDEKVAQLQRQLHELLLIQKEQKDRLDKAEHMMETLNRKAFEAERRLVKLRLMTFFERKNMAKDLRREQNTYFEQLKAEIATLTAQLKSERDKSQHLLVEDYRNVDVVKIMLDSMSAAARPHPPAATSLVRDSDLDDAMGLHGQVEDMKGELEVLRNANLTQFERMGHCIVDSNTDPRGDKYAFAPTMEMLDEEIAVLDTCISSGYGGLATLAASYADMLDLVHEELNAAVPLHNVFGANADSKAAAAARDAMQRVPSDGGGGDDCNDELSNSGNTTNACGGMTTQDLETAEDANFWKSGNDGLASQTDVDLFKILRSRSASKRERARELDLRTALSWVYDILQRKSSADILLQTDASLPCRSVEETLYDYLDEKYGNAQASNLVVYDLVRFVEEHRRNNTFLQLFARSVTGAFDAEWKYVVRVQQYSHALHPTGFANIGTVQNFFIRQLYPDQSRKEIDKVMTSLSNFSPYIRHLAEAGSLLPSELPHASSLEKGADAAETEDGGGDTHRPISAGLLAEFVASLLERDDEPRFRKALILIQVDGFDEPNPMSYAQFEALSAKCTPHEVEVKACQSYYRMLLQAYPDRLFPARSLGMCIATLELEVILARHNVSPHLRLSV